MRSRPSGQTAAVVVLDLRGRAMVRGGSTSETSQPSLEVPRNAMSLNLELPMGNDEGAYDVALINPSGAEAFLVQVPRLNSKIHCGPEGWPDLAGISPVRIFSACASQAWNGCDFLFACSEATSRQRSESLAGHVLR